jgi:hypothetical protein
MMAVARFPFCGDTRRSTYQCIINGVYKQPSFLSDSLSHLISIMLETGKGERVMRGREGGRVNERESASHYCLF